MGQDAAMGTCCTMLRTCLLAWPSSFDSAEVLAATAQLCELVHAPCKLEECEGRLAAAWLRVSLRPDTLRRT
eukprot:4918371-Amphidinium_carterae.2